MFARGKYFSPPLRRYKVMHLTHRAVLPRVPDKMCVCGTETDNSSRLPVRVTSGGKDSAVKGFSESGPCVCLFVWESTCVQLLLYTAFKYLFCPLTHDFRVNQQKDTIYSHHKVSSPGSFGWMRAKHILGLLMS